MRHVHLTIGLVLRSFAVFLLVVGVVIIVTGGWTLAYSPIAVGLALLVVDEATRRRRGGAAGV
jgi:uncharacterized membrane protein